MMLSLTTRLMAFAQTFSLLSTVNLKFFVNSNVTVPAPNWLYTALR